MPSLRSVVASELGAERSEQGQRRGDRADPAQRVEWGERAQQLGLGAIVGIDAAGEAVDRLLGRGVHLERQRLERPRAP